MIDIPITLFHEEMGRGKPFVFIHGFPLDHATWLPVAGILAKKAHCILPDLRGLGKSPVPGTKTTIPQMAEDVIRLIDTLEVDKACFVGHSMGGYVAMQIARAYPERVFGLGLVATRSEPDSTKKAAERLASRDAVLNDGTSGLIDTMAERLTNRPEIRRLVKPVMQKTSPQGIALAQYAMAIREDATVWLRELTYPIVVVAGGRDVISPEKGMKDLCSQLMDGRWYFSSRASHMLPLEEPGLIARALEETYLND